MDFDSVLLEIGEFGRYQQTNYMLLCLPVLFGAANSLSYVFTAGIPNYRCFVPGCDEPGATVYDQHWVHNAVPGKTDADGLFKPELCDRYGSKTNVSRDNTCIASSFDHQQVIRCDEWVFDTYEHTIVQEWLITCKENQWMLALIGTMHFAGIVVGSALAGVLADSYGRKNIFIISILFMSLTGIGQAISNSYIVFALFAFLNAVGTAGVFPLAFIIGVEMVGRKKREMSGIVLNYFYAIGEALVGILAWWVRDWVTLQYLVSAPPILFIVYYWMVPESVRWLMAKKKMLRAGKIVRKAAKINGKELSNEVIQAFELKSVTDDDDFQKTKKLSDTKMEEQEYQTWQTFKQFLTSKVLLARVLILVVIWATNAFVFYGLSLNSTSFSGNKYLNFILVCLVEIPGYTLSWVTMNKIGRRWSLAGSLLLCAFTCMAGGFAPQDWTWLITILFLLGKLGVTSAFATAYVHTAEMLPTVIRSGGVGAASTVARFGALVAPFVPLLNYIYPPLPLLLFGTVSLIAGLLALLLPETLGYKLPDTAEEAELLGRKKWSDDPDVRDDER